ncbi:MAG: hypothetical protein A2Z16_03430 [Chloroflexi bacterium RBG_16_54_18]|nr:MAG: hypothetical protein A2Z16_03430 [Chloroflexi bacterium RBG_16_54_18]
MNSRQRFLECMRFGTPDRPPCFQEGLRDDVLEKWRGQGMPAGTKLDQLFYYDQREEVSLDLYSRLDPVDLAGKPLGLERWKRSLDPADEHRLPPGWKKDLDRWRERQHVLMVQVHPGFFETLGIGESRSFTRALYLIVDQPVFVRSAMAIHGEFAARLLERFLKEVQVDAAVFSEPIAGNHGPLISPRTYSDLVLPTYQPVLDVLSSYGVETVILRTYANARVLLPVVLQAGFNCLWAVETEPDAMDYRAIRQEFGRELRLIGGIDVDVLRQGEQSVRSEIEGKVRPLLAQGGYIPLADGRVRSDMPFENYRFYRQYLESTVRGF